jgi:general secretion pathway protein L
MTTLVTRLPVSETDDPAVWRVTDGEWQACGVLSALTPHIDDTSVMALVSPADARCIWSSLPDLEPRQAEGVARLKAGEQSLGPIHAVARHIGDDVVVTATISAAHMEAGLARLAQHGLSPDIVIPLGLAIDAHPDHVVKAAFDGVAVLRGERLTAPDEAVFRKMLLGNSAVEGLDSAMVQTMLRTANEHPLLNLREGLFAKREQIVWTTAAQRKWIVRLAGALVIATLLVGILSWARHAGATDTENDRALAAAQKIDPSISDIAQAEAQLGRALQQRGISKGRFGPLSAGLWRAVQSSPNVSVRELRYGADGILVGVLAAPNADSVNRALVAIQQDGYRITATPRQDGTGATLVDLTMRMP